MPLLKPKFSFIILLTFIVFTIVGTLSHEMGHIAMARFLGYETELYYGSMQNFHKGYKEDEDAILFDELNKKFNEKYKNAKFEDVSDEDKKEINLILERLEKKFPVNKEHQFLITLGGPLQTLITCFIGLCIIIYRRKYKNKETFSNIDWLSVFLSLFILREIYNTVMAIGSVILLKEQTFYGDEFRMSIYLNLNQWVIPIITAIIGCIITYYVIFKVIPKTYRFSFMVSGFIGGLLGFFIWFNILGPIVLP